jgi:tRNA (guanine10-N2)-methyltransferase
MEFLIRFAQTHLSFRVPEIEALAIVEDIDLTILQYSDDVGAGLANHVLVP